MGYITNYYGRINLYDKKAIEILKKEIEEDGKYLGGGDKWDFDINEDDESNIHLDINGGWKDYDDLMLRLCYFVSMIDKKSNGEIECRGEENEDIWRIRILEGGVVLQEHAQITYDEGSEFKDIGVMKDVYKITKDKTLMKELIVESL